MLEDLIVNFGPSVGGRGNWQGLEAGRPSQVVVHFRWWVGRLRDDVRHIGGIEEDTLRLSRRGSEREIFAWRICAA